MKAHITKYKAAKYLLFFGFIITVVLVVQLRNCMIGNTQTQPALIKQSHVHPDHDKLIKSATHEAQQVQELLESYVWTSTEEGSLRIKDHIATELCKQNEKTYAFIVLCGEKKSEVKDHFEIETWAVAAHIDAKHTILTLYRTKDTRTGEVTCKIVSSAFEFGNTYQNLTSSSATFVLDDSSGYLRAFLESDEAVKTLEAKVNEWRQRRYPSVVSASFPGIAELDVKEKLYRFKLVLSDQAKTQVNVLTSLDKKQFNIDGEGR